MSSSRGLSRRTATPRCTCCASLRNQSTGRARNATTSSSSASWRAC
nr:MAG TPA: hypothetical protein [Caudoviricetes sp.]